MLQNSDVRARSFKLGASGDQFLKLVERAGPAPLVTIASLLVEELLVGKGEQRTIAVGLDVDRDQGFAFRRRLPGPGEDEFLVRHEFAIDAADIVLFAVRALHQPAITPADARIALDFEHFDLAWTHPALY